MNKPIKFCIKADQYKIPEEIIIRKNKNNTYSICIKGNTYTKIQEDGTEEIVKANIDIPNAEICFYSLFGMILPVFVERINPDPNNMLYSIYIPDEQDNGQDVDNDRLISANRLKKVLDKNFYSGSNVIKQIIDNQPTAFNVKNILKQISDCICGQGTTHEDDTGEMIAYNEGVADCYKIIESGIKNEE